MKNLTSSILFIFLSIFLLQGCLPDSFTKFKEDKATAPSIPKDSSGATNPDVAPFPSSCNSKDFVNGGACISPISINYEFQTSYAFQIGTEVDLFPTLEGSAQNAVDYTSFEITTIVGSTVHDSSSSQFVDLADYGVQFSTGEGTLFGFPVGYLKKTTFRIRAFHHSISGFIKIVDIQLDISFGTKLSQIQYPQRYGDLMTLKVGDKKAKNFIGSSKMTSSNNLTANLHYIDTENDELHIYFDPTSAGKSSGDPLSNQLVPNLGVDNQSFYTSSESVISTEDKSIVRVFPYGTSISSFIPATKPILSAAESLELRYEISPPLPDGFSFETETGRIFDNQPSIAPNALPILEPTEYDITVSDLSGNSVSTKVTISYVPVYTEAAPTSTKTSAPRSVIDFQIPQIGGTNVIVTVDDASAFTSKEEKTVQGKDGSTAYVRYVDTAKNLIYLRVNTGRFDIGSEIDSSIVYAKTDATVTDIEYAFSTKGNYILGGSNAIPINPLVLDPITGDKVIPHQSEIEALKYTMTPFFPSDTTLELTDGNGADKNGVPLLAGSTPLDNFFSIAGVNYKGIFATGTVETLKTFVFTVQAENQSGRKSEAKTIKVRFETPPTYLSLSNRVLLPVTSVTSFKKGNFITSPAAPPLVDDNLGTVLGTVGNNIYVEVLSGNFSLNDPLDNIQKFAAERTRVSSAPLSVGGILNLNGVPNVTVGDVITYGVVPNETIIEAIYIDGTNLYFRPLKNNVSSGDQFVDNTPTTITVNDIEAQNIVFDITANAGSTYASYKVGSDITSNSASSSVGVITGNGSPNVNSVNVQVNEGTFNNLSSLNRVNPFIASATSNPYSFAGIYPTITASSVSMDNHFNIYRNDSTTLVTSLKEGSDTLYRMLTTDPANPPNLKNIVPSGLSFNTDNGILEGQASDSQTRTDYTLRAVNAVGEATFDFSLKVHNHFQILDLTPSLSYNMHKVGQSNAKTTCRITQDQIDAGTTGDVQYRDINCILDAGELDLREKALSINTKVSAGICHYFNFKPFAFWGYKPHQTPATTVFTKRTGDNCGAFAAGEVYPEGAPTCFGDYKTDGFNCDEGAYTLKTENYTFDPDAVTCTTDTTIDFISCGGNKNACLAGPLQQIFDKTDSINVLSGAKGKTNSSEFGFDKTWEFKKANNSNASQYYANYSAANSCAKQGLDANDSFNYSVTPWVNYINSFTVNSNNIIGALEGVETNPFYTFECLDAAQDLIARVRLQVRDWDILFSPFDDPLLVGDNSSHFQARVPASSFGGASGTSYQDAGSDKDAFGNFYNGAKDWDDFLDDVNTEIGDTFNSCGAVQGATDPAITLIPPMTQLTGQITLTASSTDVTGVGTAFTTETQAINHNSESAYEGTTIAYRDSGNAQSPWYYLTVVLIDNDTSMLVLSAPTVIPGGAVDFFLVKSYPFIHEVE